MISRHLKPDIKTFLHANILLDVREALAGNIDDARRPHGGGEGQSVRVDVSDHHLAGSGLARDRRRHAANGAGPGD